MNEAPEHLPQGAFRRPDGGALWRVWAPRAERVALVTWRGGRRAEEPMTPTGHGYFARERDEAEEGLRYAYTLDRGPERPDPASRFQPDGVHRPSALFSPGAFAWTDHEWPGIRRDDLVIYELHVGTFTERGVFEQIMPRFEQLIDLGVTAIELMPVAQFPGGRGWGYDAVHPYAVQNTYGGPGALQRLVGAAHAVGLGVILDVVYNHLGPEGNYLADFGPYFTDAYRTPWGAAMNFDGPESGAVRRYVIDNTLMWVRDFHIDGLRLDAVHAIYDRSPLHILAELRDAVHAEAARQGRPVHVIAESDENDVRHVLPRERGGHQLDAVWSDDFHHAVHATLTGERRGYYRDFEGPEDLAKAFNDVFVYDGRYSPYRRRRHGTRATPLDRTRFVVCIQNHDQVGNRAMGDRFGTLLSGAGRRLACGLLLISPCVPLLFMGEEYGERRPFPFFCSFSDPELVEAVRKGRREEFASFEWAGEIPDPQDPATFESARLAWDWPAGSERAGLRLLYRDLLGARRGWPALRDRQHTAARVEAGVLVIERGAAGDLIAFANVGRGARPVPEVPLGDRVCLLSTEARRYATGEGEAGEAPGEELAGHELRIYGPGKWRHGAMAAEAATP